MFKTSAVLTLSAAAFAVAASSAVSAEAYTTRIEPRPFYGAVVTLEEGVRVIRPLPPERHVIINPGNATPLSLGFNETNVYENRTIRNYNYNEGGASSGSTSYSGRAGFYGPGFAIGGHGAGRGAARGAGYGVGRSGGHSGHGGHH